MSSFVGYFVHPSSVIDEGAVIGEGTRIWHFCHVMGGARIGRDCVVGQNVFIGADVVVGDRVRIQNNVSLYTGVTLEDDVFVGPSAVFTNVRTPRSAVSRRHAFESTRIGRGATIGANATIVCGVTIGEYAFIGAGAVVTRAVPPYGLAYGNPARLRGWMCRCGARLTLVRGESLRCRACGARYRRGANSSVSSLVVEG